MNFSLEGAKRYIQDQANAFRQKGVELGTRLNTAYALYQRALNLKDGNLQSQAAAVITELQTLRDRQKTIEAQVDQYVPKFQLLGVIPLAVLAPAVAIPLAVLLYNHLQAIQNQKRALDLVERGILTAEQAKGIAAPSFFGNLVGLDSLNTTAKLALVGLGVFLIWPFLVRR